MSREPLYSLLQETAARHGDRPAVVFGDDGRTYAQLLNASDRLARLLADQGAEPGRRVAFCFQKSIDALISMFAIVRTGAAYVPLDPAWPAERITAICQDADIHMWTGSRMPPKGVGDFETVIVSNPDDSGAIALNAWWDFDSSGDPPCVPENGIANILYTSGSTGRPKGVMITTQSLLHFSRWVVDTFALTSDDRLANHAPFHFDLSTLDIFAAVRAGATMCPVPERLKMFPYQMARFIADREITVWYSVPSALILMQMKGQLADHDLSRLRHVIFAGEVMPKPALRDLARALSHAEWTNLYGPTETNVCTFHLVDRSELEDDSPVPIGQPISETRIWIVDEQGKPISDERPGELWVAGPTLTHGYLGDAESTRWRRATAPDGCGSAWRTGDRVRRRADGVLLFEGRIDRMIKCRGHRIEPGEIETALCRHPAIREAAVVPIPDPVFGNRLKACVATSEVQSPTESELIAHCRECLPVTMLPDEWQFHDALPRTDRGKINMQALMR